MTNFEIISIALGLATLVADIVAVVIALLDLLKTKRK